jgi:hypothetical protein
MIYQFPAATTAIGDLFRAQPSDATIRLCARLKFQKTTSDYLKLLASMLTSTISHLLEQSISYFSTQAVSKAIATPSHEQGSDIKIGNGQTRKSRPFLHSTCYLSNSLKDRLRRFNA